MLKVLEAIGISANEFENRCGLGHGFVTRLTSNIGKKTRAKIKEVYPTLNMDYVSHDKGEMFCEEPQAKETVKDRLSQFASFMNITDKELLRQAGLSPAFISNMSGNIRKSSADRITAAFPMLSQEWVLFGTGTMLIDGKRQKENGSVNERIRKIVKFLGTTISSFEAETGISSVAERSVKNISKTQVDKITRRFPFINPIWLISGSGTMITEPPKIPNVSVAYAPLVQQHAYAGYLNGFADEEYIEKLEKIPYVITDEAKGNMIAIEITGDSMDDGTCESYRDKDIVLCREIPILDDSLPYKHYDFVIVHSEGILIKRITELDISHGTMVIHSLNKFYGDVKIDLNDVRKIFAVVMKISKQKR